MSRSNEARMRSSTQMTASRDFSKVADFNDTYKENEDANRGINCRLM